MYVMPLTPARMTCETLAGETMLRCSSEKERGCHRTTSSTRGTCDSSRCSGIITAKVGDGLLIQRIQEDA